VIISVVVEEDTDESIVVALETGEDSVWVVASVESVVIGDVDDDRITVIVVVSGLSMDVDVDDSEVVSTLSDVVVAAVATAELVVVKLAGCVVDACGTTDDNSV
jgi:hypothetical protein